MTTVHSLCAVVSFARSSLSARSSQSSRVRDTNVHQLQEPVVSQYIEPEHLSQGVCSDRAEQRAKSKEQRAKSKEQRAESRE